MGFKYGKLLGEVGTDEKTIGEAGFFISSF
jgi:hypothetical protein